MYQEALRSPMLLRAQSLQSHGILAYDHPNPLQFGEPITDEFETPMCVEHMGVRSLRKEFAEWNKVAANYDSQITKGFPEVLGGGIIPSLHFGAAAISAGMYAILPSTAQSPLVKSILVGATLVPIITGCGYLVSHWDNVNQRKKDIISYEIAKGNADICQKELKRRGRAVHSHHWECSSF
jgi:hypothetical protein